MTDVVTNAEYRAALGSIRYNASNFQVLTLFIVFFVMTSLAVLAGSMVALQSDSNMSSNSVKAVIITMFVFLVMLAFAYVAYLRNIGRYVASRIRGAFATNEKLDKCKAEGFEYSTGTSPWGRSTRPFWRRRPF